jgi:alpha-beta hydrolase superfamily lysophospholipase
VKNTIILLFFLIALGAAGELRAATFQAAGNKPAAVVFDNETYDFELRRVLGMAVSRGSDVNECLETAHAIQPGDAESWYVNWYGLAERVRRTGEECLRKGHAVSAREAFFRASTYYRSAGFFLVGNPRDSRIVTSWKKSRDMFRKGARLGEYPVAVVSIPYEKTTLPGYVLQPDRSGKKRKTVIIQTGFDGTAEELYFENALFALRRGWTVILFEGPGQGGALHEQGLTFRPDWENVITPVVDFALTRNGVDPERIALMGISMGGYLAPRGASGEHRLAALVANPGTYDMLGHRRADAREWEEMRSDPDGTNTALRQAMGKDIGFRWFIENGMLTTGTKTPLQFLEMFRKFNMQGLADRITCPTLVIVGAGDHFSSIKDQRKLYDELACPKTLLVFDKASFADEHCQMGALMTSNQRIFDWLDETVDR